MLFYIHYPTATLLNATLAYLHKDEFPNRTFIGIGIVV